MPPKPTSSDSGNKEKEPGQDPLFQIERFIEAVNEDSQRSRSLMVALIFAALLVSIALVNSFKQQFSWYKSRIGIKKVAQEWMVFPDDPDSVRQRSFHDMGAFALFNEKLYGAESLDGKTRKIAQETSLPYWTGIKRDTLRIRQYQDPASRFEFYCTIREAAEHIELSNTKTRHELNLTVDELIQVHIEHLLLVRIPILGISFDVNYLGVFGGITFISLYLLLYYSLVREYRNLKTLFKRAWGEKRYHQHQFYEFISMYQVLDVPKRLYSDETNQRDRWLRSVTLLGHLFPAIILIIVFAYDLYTTGLGASINGQMAHITSIFTAFFIVVVLTLLWVIYKQEDRMNLLWDNQACEFNIEYILEMIGEDEIDIEELKGKTLDAGTAWKIKEIFYSIFSTAYGNSGEIPVAQAMGLLENFLHRIFKKEYLDRPAPGEPDKGAIGALWEVFKEWSKKSGRHNLEEDFRTSFANATNGYFKEKPPGDPRT